VEYIWSFGDGASSTAQNPTHTYSTAGSYTVTLTVKDDKEATATDTTTLTVAGGFPSLTVTTLIGAIILAAALYFVILPMFKKRQKEKMPEPPKPQLIVIQAYPTEIPADGRSSTTLTMTLLDSDKNPIQAPEDIEVTVTTTNGKLDAADGRITIKKGETTGRAALFASTTMGAVDITASSPGLEYARMSLMFSEKRRYCMNCGSSLKMTDLGCPKCHSLPPSGTDVKKCMNCGEVIPALARFCGECGARQPKQDDRGL
jgi:RNA polymerase subunit RPABC4/transcription elongation factor Spt4